MAEKSIKEAFNKRDIVSIEDFSIQEIDYILAHAKRIEENPDDFKDSMSGKIMAPLFFEDSTRTTCSFQMAMLKMNGKVLDFDVERSSIKKGESLRDTLKTIEAYEPDVIVIRHSNDGVARFAAEIVDIPIINAGDGKNQHPTQTLLDLYTILQIRGTFENINLAIAGDLKYGRTTHSLALALSRYKNCQMHFVSPEYLKMPKDILGKLNERGVVFNEHSLEELASVASKIDIIYMTRVQRERFPEGPEGDYEYAKVSKQYCLKFEMLKNVSSDFKIMHPLPKITEIEHKIDDTKYAYYFQQVKNGVCVRKALLELVV
jgi:aspartate carbamoyltransferase catalytic subunit